MTRLQENDGLVCGGCGCDVTYTGYAVDYRLVLASEGQPSDPYSNVVMDFIVADPLPEAIRFCNLRCLKQWIEQR